MNRFIELPPAPYNNYREYYLADLRSRKRLGSMNRCPKCYKTGEFGSVISVMDVDEKHYLICGWCQTVHECKEENTDDVPQM